VIAVDEETLWTRAYGDEYWADVTSPLFFSLLGEYLTDYVNHEGARIMGYWEIADKDLLRLHKGHIYFNTEVLEYVFTFNPKFSRTKELLNYFPEKDQERVANAKTKIGRRIWAEIRIMLLDPDGMITRTDKAHRRWAESFLSKMKRFDSLDLTKLSDEELYVEFKDMENAFLKHYRLIRYGLVTHSIGSNLILKRWLVDWLDDKSGAIYSKLISGLPDNKTITTNTALVKLSKAARRNPHVLDLLQQKSSRGFLAEIDNNPHLKDFSAEFHGFLRDYGHRSHTREMFFPRWTDDPSLVADVLKSLVSSRDLDVEALERQKSEERIAAEKDALDRVSTLKFGFFKKLLFKTVLRYAQTYLMFRENQRFYLDHTIYRQRRLFMEYASRFKERGIISDPDDIHFLSKEEIFKIQRHELSVPKETIKQRREEFDKYANRLPPKFLKGTHEFDDTMTRETDTLRITGTGASPGIATGLARVVGTINELPKIKQGEIMVTSNTDPGWTPVFPKLGGLITETGGILSHGAVVSREYNIPAVTAVRDATRILKTGQKITVNGNDGVVTIMEG
jgi:phosphoenolpyruvate synthase/pyruvate phosphate dikinase